MRSAGAALLIAALILLAAAGVRAGHSIRHDNALNFVSGAWIALADDLSQGVFYRPLVDENGFGGTRFFPLQFTLHAGLIRLGIDPFHAGHLLSIIWTILLLGGIFVFLRRAGAPLAWSAGGAMISLSSSAVFNGLVDVRGDVLPAALNVWGLALLLTPEGRKPAPLAAAAIFFTLAFAAKVTTIFGAAAGCAALLLGGRRADGFRLGALCAVGYAVVLGLIFVASGGRIVEIFLACAAGGTGVGYLMQSPIWTTSHQLGHDPIGFAIVILALGVLAGCFKLVGRELVSLSLLATLAVTLLIFGSPGTSFNHLIDVTVIAVIFVVVQATRGRLPGGAVAGVLAIIGLVAAMQHLDQYRDSRDSSRRTEMRKVIAACDGTGPILSEDPLVPLVGGERPYLLDSWMMRVMSRKDPSIIGRVNDEIAARKFRAIVLLTDPQRGGGKFLEDRVFGPGFVPAVNEHYRKDQQIGRFAVYLPK